MLPYIQMPAFLLPSLHQALFYLLMGLAFGAKNRLHSIVLHEYLLATRHQYAIMVAPNKVFKQSHYLHLLLTLQEPLPVPVWDSPSKGVEEREW